LEQAEQEKSEADAQVRALEEKHARLKEKRERITTIRQQEQEQHDEIDRLHSDIAHAETLLQRREEILAGVQQLEAARTSLAHIESLRPRYDELSEAYRQLQDRLKDEQRRVQSDLDGHRRESQRIQQQLARRPALVAQREKLEQHLAALAPLADERAQVDEQRVELDERLSQANQLLLQRSEHLSTISEAYNALEATRKEQQRLITRLERQMSDVSRWRSELEEAQQHQQRVQELGNSLAELRQHEQSAAERAGELRAQCTQFKQQADDIKKRQALLDGTTTTTCPLCGSNLGEDGTATIAAHYESEIGHLREQYRLSQKEAQKHEADIKHLRDEIASQQTDLAQAQHHAARIDTLRQQLEQARGWQDELAQAQQTLEHTSKQLADDDYAREAREALLTLEETLLALGAEKSRKKSKKGEQTVFLTTALEAERTRLKQRATELERQLDTRTSIESEAATVRHQFDALQHDENSLPALEQQIAHLEQVIEQGDFGHELRVQASEVEAQIAQLGYTNEAHAAARDSVRQLSHWSEEQQKLMVAENTLDRDRRAVQRASELLERYTAEREQLASDVVELEQQVKVLPDVQKHAAACDEQVKARREELDSSRNDLSEKQTLYKNAQQKAAQLETKQAERATVAEQQDIFRELAEACGKKGVQAMLIETAIPEIEREANRLLGRITDNQMHVTLDMQRSTKKGDTVETLDIKIADALGTRTYDAFSGGEAMRINFALRVALSRLLARRAGASLETLVIDEGFGMLDAEGRERFVEAITSVQQDFRRILVITHIDDLKDRFPAQIQITKTPTGSVFEIV
jgi:exonuclease SbcC